jgi:hypothetical protein
MDPEREEALRVFYDALLSGELQMGNLAWFMQEQGFGDPTQGDRALLHVWLWQVAPLIEKISGTRVYIGPGLATWIAQTIMGLRGSWLRRVLVTFPEGWGAPVLVSTSDARGRDRYHLLDAARAAIVTKEKTAAYPWTVKAIKLNRQTGTALQKPYATLSSEDLEEFLEWFEERIFGQKVYMLSQRPWQDITDREG